MLIVPLQLDTIFFTLLSVLLIISIQNMPIINGFSLKSFSAEEEAKPNAFGAFFAKIPQDLPPISLQGDKLSDPIFALPNALGSGCTNQIAKIFYPLKNSKSNEVNKPKMWVHDNFIRIPVGKQPVDAYNILVAIAPSNIKLGKKGDSLRTVIYVVFPDQDVHDVNDVNLPSVYFVNTVEGKVQISKKEKVEPILIIDNNRTVTGLTSKKISKFVKFKNKLTNLYDYKMPAT